MIAWVWGVAFAVPVREVPNPRDRGGWVTDLADVIAPAEEAELERRLGALHQELDVEVAVVTVRGIDDAASPKAFATELFGAWGIGDREANNGLLTLLVLDERRLEMETGYGLEPLLPDGWLGLMQSERMVPSFKQGDYGAGLVLGIAAVEERLREHPEDARLGTGGPIAVAHRQQRRTTQAGVGAAVAGVVAAGGLAGVLGARHRRRQRTCEKCGLYMPMLEEAEDDAHLDAGQRKEEAVGSVDWQVHQCPQCSAVHTFASRRWFSGYSACPQCAHRTRSSTSTTVRHATRYSGGLVRVDERCAHCSYRASSTRHTPRLPEPSTTSSSSFGGGGFGGGGGGGGGGGSFGGGSSGGGGAGSSW